MYRIHKIINKIQCVNYSSKVNKYTNTVLLPKTKFPQRLLGKKLTDQNKHIYEKGGFDKLYSWQKLNLDGADFILHDGPPYANGVPHMGHAINKILKDVINRHNVLRGQKINYVPGWDCHGLPIELKAMSKVKKSGSTPVYIRKIAQDFATKTIGEQSKIFQSWGVMGDWQNPYFTYSVPYIQNQLKQFYKLYAKKLIYRDVKPVFWSPSSRTALAEAELEYNENHKSTSVICRLKISAIPKTLLKFLESSSTVYALIWTTTPWTLPSNQAICYNPDLSYSFVKNSKDNHIYLVATELIDNISKRLQCDLKLIGSFLGSELATAKYFYPFEDNEQLPFLPGQHATVSKGTGLVHTAPAHGPDDFVLALNHKIPVKCIVDESGRYTSDTALFKGLPVLQEGNQAVLQHLKTDILCTEDYIHSYPYDWRTKKPVILRASQQWFIDTNAIKDRAIELIQTDVTIYPEKNSTIYKNSLITQVKKRPYWCISRQRVWGVPIPVFYNKNTGEPIISELLINHLCSLLKKHGTDFWWTLQIADMFPLDIIQEFKLNVDDIEKGGDILDIWFDSGVSWSSVLGEEKIADVYLEGVDQFNGWFQSSLMTSVALRDKAPYKTIYVHGFAVDQNGHKMSKSLGNVIDPQEIIHGSKKQAALGIDTLRWWVACHASRNATAYISQNVLQASADEVQKIRNTMRFAIGALTDFDNKIDISSLKIIDKYLLHLLYEFDEQVMEMYKDYQFNRICINIINFVTNPVSALYYSIIKDRLYCDKFDSSNRRTAQFVLQSILNIVSKTIGPIMPHLAEELHMYRNNNTDETFFKTPQYKMGKEYEQMELLKIMDHVLNIKKELNKQINNTVEMDLVISASADVYENLKVFQAEEFEDLVDILQVSRVVVNKSLDLDTGKFELNTTKSKNVLCPRCKRYNSNCEGQLCLRCIDVVELLNNIQITA